MYIKKSQPTIITSQLLKVINTHPHSCSRTLGYISHLPGNLDEIINMCEQTSANGLKKLAVEYQIPPTPANFLQFEDTFLTSALALVPLFKTPLTKIGLSSK